MTIYSIASRAELAAALSRATGGETFVLAPGEYGALSIEDRKFKSAVTIQSADPERMAKFSSFEIDGSQNVTLKSLDIGRAMAAHEVGYGKIVSVVNSKAIDLTGLKVHGSLDGDPRNDGYGLYVKGSTDVAVTGSEFTDLARGAVFDSATKLVIENNDFHVLRSDGVNFTGSSSVLVKDNRFSDFFIKAGDHSDAIQFFTAGQKKAAANITITGNEIFQGEGNGPQGIFIQDETGKLPYLNVTIDNNILYGNDQWHGIMVSDAKNVKVTNNTAVSASNDSKRFWIKLEDVSNATVSKNVTDDVLTDSSVTSLKMSGNVELRWDKLAAALIPNVNKGALTKIGDLLMKGVGYQSGQSSATLEDLTFASDIVDGNDSRSVEALTLDAENPVASVFESEWLESKLDHQQVPAIVDTLEFGSAGGAMLFAQHFAYA